MASAADTVAIPSFGSYISGRDVDSGDTWVYVPRARSTLTDSFRTLTAKRRLDSGELPATAADPDVFAGRVAVADDRTIVAALESAAAAARVWRSAPLETRVDRLLEQVRANIVDHTETIEQMLTVEGHPLQLARWEIAGWLEACDPLSRSFFRGELHKEFSYRGRRQIVRRRADGVVCVNPPANAPMSSAIFAATLSAVAGNAVVVRLPRSVPLGAAWALRVVLGAALDAVGAPAGTVNAVCGEPEPVLQAWLASPLVDDIMYFGSVENGLNFEKRCVAAGKKPILELAGNDIVVVWSDTDLDHASDALLEGFFGSGQLCMIPNLVLVHPDVADDLIARVAKKAQQLRPGYPDDEDVLLSPVLRHDRFRRVLDDALAKGAQLITGGSGMHLDGTPGDSGYFLQPTVLRVDGLERARELEAVEHETFFPLLPIVVPAPESDERLLARFIDFVNSNLYGLRNSLWAADAGVIQRYVDEVVNGGLLKVNDSHIAFSAPLPSHGGTGLTGGAVGEANYPVLRTTHIQGVSVLAPGTAPRYH
ncbi:aldehyde dehydrogenase [Nocardia veterana]|uniref:Aldehyde dehydrogenase n=2 Tax=Nocardia veterana TaxID=132249 RepID=A0A7X6RFX4_9NOCA|nr:aldehyde dehydrogenase [Nocardia veterana]NKY84038.1 aldehyde dehydrogenase [Nocardia veterana]